MDATEILQLIATYGVMAVGIVGALILARWGVRSMGLLGGGGSSGSVAGDRTFDGWFSHMQGMTGYESNYSATHKSVERHLRKNR